MEGDLPLRRKAQLDKAEREHLEDVVADMRERVEDTIELQLTQKGLDDEPANPDELDDDTQQLVEAIALEDVDGDTWDEAFERYVTGVGYTIVNRLAGLRCMEVRGFIGEEITVFKDDGLTPAAETLVHEEFLLEDEALLEAYHNACDELAAEIGILFDRSSAYSLIDPDDDTFEELCGRLDDVPDDVWRADDVLGWIYEYYHVKLLDDLRRKGDREGLEPEDVPLANQFYTPHWVVRMLTDNSLGKLYLERTGELQDVVESRDEFSSDERKNRPLSPDESPNVADFCTYLVPSEEDGESTEFDHPSELRVIDPACGSGHFLLYAFDVLERIWRAETDLSDTEIPRKILKHNLYGVDLDVRACQLAVFNLYLKGRTRAEAAGASGFDMPEVGIVCADASIADLEGVEEVFGEVADDNPDVRNALGRILDAFEEVHGLGSLLDVRGTLSDVFDDEADAESAQSTPSADPGENHTLGRVLHGLREAVDERRESDSFLAEDLRSFIRLVDVLGQEYDVTLMNPPYGSRNRMPEEVKQYVRDHYEYKPEFYINFFEVCESLAKDSGRIGMLIPRTFMYKSSFEEFRKDFVGDRGTFDFLAEYGIGVLDNATVRTVGSVVRIGDSLTQQQGSFYRLHDLSRHEKENGFIEAAFGNDEDQSFQRRYEVEMDEFRKVPGSPISYWIPTKVRDLYEADTVFDAERGNADRQSLGETRQGLITSNDDRFVRRNWETDGGYWVPFATGGRDAWVLPKTNKMLNWRNDGAELRRIQNSATRNYDVRFDEALAYNRIKETGRRFGILDGDSIFSDTGMAFVPDSDSWTVLAYANSDLVHYLMLGLTIGRHWNVTEVGKIPWPDTVADVEELSELPLDQFTTFVQSRITDVDSPHYVGTGLLPADSIEGFFYDHPHVEQSTELLSFDETYPDPDVRITEAARIVTRKERERRQQLEDLARRIDDEIFDALSIPNETRTAIRDEIFLRTAQDREDRNVPDPQSVPEVTETLDEQVKDLVHHFAMEAIRNEGDGIIPLEGTDTQATMLDRVIERFDDAYGEYAEDRLVEVDTVLGATSAADEAYPNLRAWLADDLFDYHVGTMENTPILWKLTTSRLVSDPNGVGFACFVDYHQLDSGLFDRLTNQYLEPRKADVRERRSAAERRRSDDSLGTSEQADAAEAYDRYASALEQISVFEDVLQNLGDVTERDFDPERRDVAEDLAPKVATFREETETRLQALDELREIKNEAWFEDTFSPNFWKQVEEWREEWLGALEDLERACREYAKPTDEPIEAHLADLFDYFNWRLKGADHYSSTGILFTTYYFEREGSNFLDANGEPKDGLRDGHAKRLATLAADLDEYRALAEEIGDDCETLTEAVPSDWADRALSEILTAGYQPNRKHGVEINITPLSDAEIVPKTVDDDVR